MRYSYTNKIYYYKLTMSQRIRQSIKSSKKKDSLEAIVEADTFRIKAQLKQKNLTIYLEDYVDWRKFQKTYKAENIDKQINSRIELQDIYHAFVHEIQNSQYEQQLIIYQFGNLVQLNYSSSFMVEKDGKITINNKVHCERNGKLVERVQQSQLNLIRKSSFGEVQFLVKSHEIQKRAIKQKYQKEISQLKHQKDNFGYKINWMKLQIQHLDHQLYKKIPKNQIKIFIKTLTGIAETINITHDASVITAKRKAQKFVGCPVENIVLIFAGKQLEDGKLLSDYHVYKQCTLYAVLKLRGSIGIFDEHLNSLCRQYLVEKDIKPTPTQVQELIDELKGNTNADFFLFEVHRQDEVFVLAGLRKYADAKYEERASEQLEDLKIYLRKEELQNMIGEGLFRKLLKLFAGRCDEIVVRRCQAHGKLISFHTDVSAKTLQVSLNDDCEYEGGRLMYATGGKLEVPKRNLGTVTVHNNRIVHGVTLFESGVRYGLFLLQK